MTDAKWMKFATRFTVPYAPKYGGSKTADIERRDQRDATQLWAVKDGSCCLAKDGEWEYEPLPSSRDEEFIARCRYATKEEALAALEAL